VTSRSTPLLVVQLITSVRVVSAIIFAATVVIPKYQLAALLCYLLGLSTDAIDGFAARRLQVSSPAGGAYDGFADKAMTVVSSLYGVAIGAPLIPCTLVLLRDLFVLSFRAIAGERTMMRPSRLNGSVTAAPLKLLTVFIVGNRVLLPAFSLPLTWYWLPGAISSISLARQIWTSRGVIAEYFADHPNVFRK